MTNGDPARTDTSTGSGLTVSIRYAASAQPGRNPIPPIGQFLVGVSELERQLRDARGAVPGGGFSLTPTAILAGESARPADVPAAATVVLHAAAAAPVPRATLLQLITALAEQIAGEAGVGCSVDVVAPSSASEAGA